MRRTGFAAAAIAVALASPALGAGSYVARGVNDASGAHLQSYWDESGVGTGPFDPVYQLPNGFTGSSGSSSGGFGSTSASGAYSAVTVTSTASQAVAAGTRVYLDLKNESTTVSIACAFGATPALNTAGSFTLPPGADKTWENSFVPADQINCLTTAGNTAPLTIGVH